MALTKLERQVITEVIRKLGPGSDISPVMRPHIEALRPYLDCWIIEPLERVIAPSPARPDPLVAIYLTDDGKTACGKKIVRRSELVKLNEHADHHSSGAFYWTEKRPPMEGDEPTEEEQRLAAERDRMAQGQIEDEAEFRRQQNDERDDELAASMEEPIWFDGRLRP